MPPDTVHETTPTGSVSETVRRTARSTRQPGSGGARLLAMAGALPGAAIGVGLGAVAALRGNKPVHPAGRVGTGHLEVTSPRPEFGVPLLASAGRHACIARFSRTLGLPASWPDVEGLALRVDDAGADILLASTGVGRLGRFVFEARSADKHGTLTTYLPVASPSGSLLLRATPLDQEDPPVEWEFSAAHAGSPWLPFGLLRVTWGDDRPVRFDPVENVLPGTRQYPLVSVLREPAYLISRRLVPRPRS